MTYRQPQDYRFESEVQADCMLHFGAVPYMRLWRNNVGVAYPISIVTTLIRSIWSALARVPFKIQNIKDALNDFKRMRPVKFSVPGSGDAFFILTGDHVTGINRGRFGNIEFKLKGQKQDPDQITWQRMLESRGGIYILATCIDDVYAGLRQAGVQV